MPSNVMASRLPRAGRRSVLARRLALTALPFALGACDWMTDFKVQPSVHTWGVYRADSAELKGFRGQPSNSVSTNGTLVPAWAVSYSPMPATIDSMSGLVNPTAPDARSLASGRRYFQVGCAPCHGDAGDANTPMRQLSPMYAFVSSLLTDQAKARSDGYIWGMMRNGRGLMKPANRIEESDRWDVVNYVRGLQGRYPVEQGAVGRPGETGDKLPGATKLGPTVPSKYFHAAVTSRPAKAEPAEGARAADGAKAEIKAPESKKPEGKP